MIVDWKRWAGEARELAARLGVTDPDLLVWLEDVQSTGKKPSVGLLLAVRELRRAA